MTSIELGPFVKQAPTRSVNVNIADEGQAVDTIAAKAVAGRGFMLFTLNLDHLVKLRGDKRFRDAYQRADLITADGWPIVWLLKQRGSAVTRTTGADLLEPVLARAAALGLPVYFIGPSPSSQKAALAILRARYPDLIIAGAEAPEFSAQPEERYVAEAAERIRMSAARLCVISLGAPKQELLAAALSEKTPMVGYLAFGAALDFISGDAARAPLWMQGSGLEWLWRMISNPRRLALRYAGCAHLFLHLALAATLRRNIGLDFSHNDPGYNA